MMKNTNLRTIVFFAVFVGILWAGILTHPLWLQKTEAKPTRPDLSWTIVYDSPKGRATETVNGQNLYEALGVFYTIHSENPTVQAVCRRSYVDCQPMLLK